MSNKRSAAFFKNLQLKRRRNQKDDFDTPDDDEIENDYEDDSNEPPTPRAICDSNRKNKLNIDIMPKSIQLPGGYASNVVPFNLSCGGSQIGEAPRETVRNIRNYMDILLNSALIEAKYLTSSESSQANSMLAIPGIVSAILDYNNISFKTIKYCITRVELFEPVWYTYNVARNELILYLNEPMYEEFCSKNSRDPVIFTSGIIPLEIFNPYENNPYIDTNIQPAIIHCAIASDHVAQHIIFDLNCPKMPACADIHDRFTEFGTTLHSMFHLERSFTKMPKREYNNYLTLGSSPTRTPLMRSTQRIIDSILPPNDQTNMFSGSFAI
ncbi:GrBNV gp13-like protein [Tomelloso virus]|uniref:GrBNV gp13-like protein n=1 Tax=Tomelloso virus TaxID=2053981 RepID=A0A2H4T2R7_9VIRU|nr:GrBNV gp13-like protein [Tomelloso virus]ATY70216.1 GrBNV gp13-like protein [Tomelloso virus]